MEPNSEVATETPKGIDAALDAALASYDEAPAAETAAAPETPEPTVDATGRAHGADGKFVAKDSAKTEAVVTDDPAKVEAKPAAEVVADPAPVQPIEPHPRWPAELKAEFAKWPPEVQKAFRARDDATEVEYTRKSQEVAEQRKAHEPLLNAVQQVSPFLQQIGFAPDKFLVESAVVAQRLMSGQPERQGEALAYLAQLHRIPPEAVLRAMGISLASGEDGRLMPQVNPEFQQLRQQVFELTQAQQQHQEYLAQQERLRAQAEFDAIGQTKDQSGAPKYPHFERVKGTMIKLVASDVADDWDKAYAIAVRGDDELYQQTVAAERQREAAKAETERQAAVEKAKNAKPVKTTTSAPGGGPQRKGLDAHLDAALERAGLGG